MGKLTFLSLPPRGIILKWALREQIGGPGLARKLNFVLEETIKLGLRTFPAF
jgi:hypothetical protein